MAPVENLLERRLYGLSQVDHVLGLKSGTARRWIDGYKRGGKSYPPVVRLESTGDETVTWGEFVEARLLAEYRDAGVPLIRMRPVVDRLRERFHPLYPLAHARPFVDEEGRELVYQVQADVGLDRKLLLVLARNDQILLTPAVEKFVRSAEFGAANGQGPIVERLRPVAEIPQVVIDPLRQFGEPVVRSVPTEVVAEQMRTGESIEGIADLYSLNLEEVQAAIRYELYRLTGAAAEAAA